MGAAVELSDFLRQYRLSKCLDHLAEHGVSSLEGLQKLSANNLKAIGFKPEVRAKLQRAIAGQEKEAEEAEEEEKFVTLEEEEEAVISGGKGGAKKNKKKSKAKTSEKTNGDAAVHAVPGEDGVHLDVSFRDLLTTIGLRDFVKVFESNNITSLASCRYVTREALLGSFGVPPEKAGLLLSSILQSSPAVMHERRLPELARDLASCVAVMRVSDTVKDQVRTSLKTNNVLSVADAREKRFALMNEVGLTADAATELGRLLDAGPANWQMPSVMPSNMQPARGMPQMQWDIRQMAR